MGEKEISLITLVLLLLSFVFTMNKTLGFLAPIMISMIIFILNSILPGRWVTGYVTKANSKEKMRYHLNGLLVFFTVVLVWFLLGYFNIMPYDWL